MCAELLCSKFECLVDVGVLEWAVLQARKGIVEVWEVGAILEVEGDLGILAEGDDGRMSAYTIKGSD
jgi:hypothetical protein